MTAALGGAIASLCLSVASLISWYIHSHTGDHDTTRKGDGQ